MSRLRVLAVTSEPPWPLDSGGHLRTFHLLSALSDSADVKLLCPVQPSQAQAASDLGAAGIDLIAVPVGSRTPWQEAGRLIGAAVRREPYVTYRRHLWPAVRVAWREQMQLNAPDVVYLDHLDSAVYLRPARGDRREGCPSVIDLHNSYSLLVRRTALEESNPVKRAFLRREAHLLRAMEIRAARACDAAMTVSENEARYFRGLGMSAVHIVPNGVDSSAFADLPEGRSGDPAVLFVGTMSWGPNAAAARFLATDVLPALRQRVPKARLLIVGRNPPADLQALNDREGVEVTGGVPDIKPYLRRASLLAVPLDAGGGTRLKILEAFAAGLPVVSTAVGAEGIDATPGVDFVRAERPGFADALAGLLNAPEVGARLAASARTLARGAYDWRRIGALAASVIAGVAARPRR